MNWQEHITFAAILSTLFFYFFLNIHDLSSLFIFIFISAISALIPDLDHEMSKGKKLADFLMIVFAVVFAISTGSVVLFFAFLGFYFLIFILFKPKHRGITHKLAFCALLSLAVFILAEINFALAFFIGYFSHLVADAL